MEYKKLCKALRIEEKIEAMKDLPISASWDVNEEIQKWIELKSLVTEEDFKNRLRIEQISETDFAKALALSEKNEDVLHSYLIKSEWFSYFKDIVDKFIVEDEKIHSQATFVVNNLFPIRAYSYYLECELRAKTNNMNNINISDVALNQLLNSGINKIYNIYSKVLIIKLKEYKEKHILEGQTGEERFTNFLRQTFTKKQTIDFYLEYPVLTRQAVTVSKHLLEYYGELLGNIEREKVAIDNLFQMNLGNITNINTSAGDTHEKGKTVVLLEFDHQHKVAYKPRNLAIAKAYQHFINLVNEESSLLKMKTVEGIYREEYAFQKFINHDACQNLEQVSDYYIRFGQLIAIIHLLCGNDMHLENLIAFNEYPILIDLETIFQGRVINTFQSPWFNLSIQLHFDSVKNTGLLPILAFANNKDGKGLDVSGLGGVAKLPFKVLMPVNAGTDEFSYDYQEYLRPGAHNIPKYESTEISFESYRLQILEGFRKMSRFFIDRKDSLLSESSALNLFRGMKVRHVLKSTETYVNLLSYTNHPNYATDMLKKEKLIENVWSYPHYNKLINKHEYSDMMFDDVPVFYSLTDDVDLITASGERISSCLLKTGYEKVQERLMKLTELEIEKQISIMEVSLGGYEERLNSLLGDAPYFSGVTNHFSLHEEAIQIAEILLENAIELNNNELTFIDVVENKENRGFWEVTPINHNFGQGMSGIALFFFEIYDLTKDFRYYEAYKKLIKTSLKLANDDKKWGVQDGKTSVLLPMLNELEKIGESPFFNDCVALLNGLMDLKTIDLKTMGQLIPLLIRGDGVFGDKKYIRLAIEFSEKIKQIDLNNVDDFSILADLSLALFCLYEKAEDAIDLDFIYQLLDLQNEYVEKIIDDENKSVKIATMRLEMNSILRKEDFDLIIKVKDEMIQSMKKSDTFVNGNIEDIDFLLEYQQIDNSISSDIKRKLSDIIGRYRELGEYGVVQLFGLPHLSLFTGLSGIGYGFLRALDPKNTTKVWR